MCLSIILPDLSALSCVRLCDDFQMSKVMSGTEERFDLVESQKGFGVLAPKGDRKPSEQLPITIK